MNAQARRARQGGIGCVSARALITFMLAATCAHAAELPQHSFDGLELVRRSHDNEGMAVVYARPDATLATYKRIMLDEVKVAFDKAWMPRPPVSKADRERIRRELADEFRSVFASELHDQGGYAIVEDAAPDVLRVTAAIIDLYIEPPGVGTSDWSRGYAVAASRMSLIAELRDAESGMILARVADKRTAEGQGRMPGVLQWTTKANNRAQARRALRIWAELLRKALDSAREAAP